jgi:hypothetical protein
MGKDLIGGMRQVLGDVVTLAPCDRVRLLELHPVKRRSAPGHTQGMGRPAEERLAVHRRPLHIFVLRESLNSVKSRPDPGDPRSLRSYKDKLERMKAVVSCCKLFPRFLLARHPCLFHVVTSSLASRTPMSYPLSMKLPIHETAYS